jgi:hypothetical protein
MKNKNFINTTIEFIKKSKNKNESAIIALWHLAKNAKDLDSLTEIASLKNLPNLVENEVRERKEIPIAVAYLTRDGIDQEERKARIEAENRAGVLAGVLESAAVTDFEREIIGNKLINKPTKALSEIAIKDYQLKESAIAVGIIQLQDKFTQLTTEVNRAMRQQIDRCSKDEVASKKLALEITNPSLAERFLSQQPKIDESEFESIFNRAIIPLLNECITIRRNSNELYINTHQIVSICKKILGDNEQYYPEKVLAGLKLVITDSETLAKIWTECVGATKASEENSIDNNFSNLLIEAEQSDDTERLSDLFSLATEGNVALYKPLLKNKNLPKQYVYDLINLLDRREVSKIAVWRSFDQDAILYAYKNNFDTMVYSDNYKSFLDKDKAIAEIMDHMIDLYNKGEFSYYSPITSNLNKLIADCDNREIIGKLPYGLTQYGHHYFEKVTEYLLDELNRNLGSDLKKWETINIIATNFDGSIDDLILASSTL